jgi:hypothetical protein
VQEHSNSQAKRSARYDRCPLDAQARKDSLTHSRSIDPPPNNDNNDTHTGAAGWPGGSINGIRREGARARIIASSSPPIQQAASTTASSSSQTSKPS